MSQTEKAEYYRILKESGVNFDKHYREYSTEELKAAADKLLESRPPAPAPIEPELSADEAAAFFGEKVAPTAPKPEAPVVPRREADPAELPGQRLNTHVEMQPIRTDDQGRIWYQEEVQKPSYAKPRGRRVLQYMESGVEERTVQDGQYVETFEVAGTGNRRPAEVKITLPSYQVGIYKDRRFPFKVHTYNGLQGFDLFEVQEYYGGAELVPTEIKRTYVENVLCYDIRTTVRAIQTEFRQLQLAGRIK